MAEAKTLEMKVENSEKVAVAEENVTVTEDKSIKTLEAKIASVNVLDGISLEDTIPFMLSDDYKERFVGEYMQAKIRYNHLHQTVIKIDAGTLEGKTSVSRLTLVNLKSALGNYLNQLEIRAELEGITLPRI